MFCYTFSKNTLNHFTKLRKHIVFFLMRSVVVRNDRSNSLISSRRREFHFHEFSVPFTSIELLFFRFIQNMRRPEFFLVESDNPIVCIKFSCSIDNKSHEFKHKEDIKSIISQKMINSDLYCFRSLFQHQICVIINM